MVGEIYYTKSGYLIDTNRITGVEINGVIVNDIENLTLDIIDEWVENSSYVKIDVDGVEIRSDDPNSASSKHYSGSNKSDNISAIEYYLKAYVFSKWVEDNFGNLQENNAISQYDDTGFTVKQNSENIGTEMFYTFDSNKTIFKTNGSLNFENSESNFYEHKRKVIQNSIQYNLNLAMIVYNAGKGNDVYQLPMLGEEEWDKLLSNISILSFMQGLPCGMKTYSNYAIVTSKNNEIMANEDEIYYVPIYNDEYVDGVRTSESKDDATLTALDLNTAHKIDCNELKTAISANTPKYFQSFASREVKYDKVWDSDKKDYVYDHVVNNCYYCIVNSNYETTSTSVDNNLKEAEIIAIAKIRNNTYKTCAFSSNYGIEFENSPRPLKSLDTIDVPDGVYEIELVISDAGDIQRSGKYLGTISIRLGDEQNTYTTTTNKEQTIKFSDYDLWHVSSRKATIYLNKDNEVTIKDKDGNNMYYPGNPTVYLESITYKYK